jgi:hypothetical protein
MTPFEILASKMFKTAAEPRRSVRTSVSAQPQQPQPIQSSSQQQGVTVNAVGPQRQNSINVSNSTARVTPQQSQNSVTQQGQYERTPTGLIQRHQDGSRTFFYRDASGNIRGRTYTPQGGALSRTDAWLEGMRSFSRSDPGASVYDNGAYSNLSLADKILHAPSYAGERLWKGIAGNYVNSVDAFNRMLQSDNVGDAAYNLGAGLWNVASIPLTVVPVAKLKYVPQLISQSPIYDVVADSIKDAIGFKTESEPEDPYAINYSNFPFAAAKREAEGRYQQELTKNFDRALEVYNKTPLLGRLAAAWEPKFIERKFWNSPEVVRTVVNNPDAARLAASIMGQQWVDSMRARAEANPEAFKPNSYNSVSTGSWILDRIEQAKKFVGEKLYRKEFEARGLADMQRAIDAYSDKGILDRFMIAADPEVAYRNLWNSQEAREAVKSNPLVAERAAQVMGGDWVQSTQEGVTPEVRNYFRNGRLSNQSTNQRNSGLASNNSPISAAMTSLSAALAGMMASGAQNFRPSANNARQQYAQNDNKYEQADQNSTITGNSISDQDFMRFLNGNRANNIPA